MLENLEHRGATGCDPCTGDGAGVTSQVPHKFFKRVCSEAGIALPDAGQYGVAMLFLPEDEGMRAEVRDIIEAVTAHEKLNLLGWRQVPVDPQACGDLRARVAAVVLADLHRAARRKRRSSAFERKLYVHPQAASRTDPRARPRPNDTFYVSQPLPPHHRLQRPADRRPDGASSTTT